LALPALRISHHLRRGQVHLTEDQDPDAPLPVLIRTANNADGHRVRVLHRLALAPTGALVEGPEAELLDRDFDDLEGTYITSGGEFLVGEIENEIVVMGGIRPIAPGVAELKRMRVHPDHQRRGLGTLILTRLEERARRLGIVSLRLDTTVSQRAARALYTGAGYREVGRTRLHGFDVILMEKSLPR
jgi:GNAT superfamily N-acetyltransferase